MIRERFAHNDRAILESSGCGAFVELYCREGTEEIVGAAIVAPHAGDLISEVTLAMSKRGHRDSRGDPSVPDVGRRCDGMRARYIRKHWQRLPTQEEGQQTKLTTDSLLTREPRRRVGGWRTDMYSSAPLESRRTIECNCAGARA